MKKLTQNTFGALLVSAFIALAAVFSPVPVLVSAECGEVTSGAVGGVECGNTDDNPDELFGGDSSIFTTVVNILLFIIGAISVIMLIIGGIRYTLSAGDSGNVTAAKNTILYAIVGLVIAFLAFAIVNWVLGSVADSTV